MERSETIGHAPTAKGVTPLPATIAAPPAVHGFILDGPALAPALCLRLAGALRRAVMARVRDTLGLGPQDGLPAFFCGHQSDGAPVRPGHHDHLFFLADPGPPARVLIVPPSHAEHRPPSPEECGHRETLVKALAGMTHLIAGADGVFTLHTQDRPSPADPVLGSGLYWRSATAFHPPRHPKRGDDPQAFLTALIAKECLARALPLPAIKIISLRRGARDGLAALAHLTFPKPVSGPILLGRDAHRGGGVFLLGAVRRPLAEEGLPSREGSADSNDSRSARNEPII